MAQTMPPRPRRNAESGTNFIRRMRGLSAYDREQAAYRQFERGNVPSFMRPENFWEHTVEAEIDGRTVEMTFRFSRDYASVGSDTDYVRVPMSPLTAQRIADRYGLALPTRRMVDLIDQRARDTGMYMPFHAAPEIARHVIDPETGAPVSRDNFKDMEHYSAQDGRWMQSPRFAEEQNRLIREDVRDFEERLRDDPNARQSDLARVRGVYSGIKKDVIYHPGVVGRNTVAIYHNGIQPLHTNHGDFYQDYSHGLRFIDRNVEVVITGEDGSVRRQTMDIADVLNHPEYFRLLSYVRMDIRKMYTQPYPRDQRTTRLESVPSRIEPEPERERPRRARRV